MILRYYEVLLGIALIVLTIVIMTMNIISNTVGFLIVTTLVLLTITSYNVKRTYERVLRVLNAIFKLKTQPTIKGKARFRYLVFQIISSKELGEDEVKNIVLNSIKEFAGYLGLSTSSVKFMTYDPKVRRGILRFNSRELKLIITALTITRSCRGVKVTIYPIRTTGTYKKAREIMRYIRVE